MGDKSGQSTNYAIPNVKNSNTTVNHVAWTIYVKKYSHTTVITQMFLRVWSRPTLSVKFLGITLVMI